MENISQYEPKLLPPDRLADIAKKHKSGGTIRSVLSISYWIFALTWYQNETFTQYQFFGLSATIAYVVLVNMAVQLIVKYVKREKTYYYAALFFSQLEIAGYTAAIYFCGGLEAAYLSLLYAALIVFRGIMAPRKHLYFTASLCVINFSIMIALCYLDVLPDTSIYFKTKVQLFDQILTILVVSSLLFLMAALSDVTSGYIKNQRDKFQRKNRLLVEENEKLKREIYEQSHAEKALRKRERRFRTVLESIEDGYYETDLNGNMTYFNDSLCDVLGYDRETLRSQNFRAQFDEHNYEILSNAFNKVYRTGTGKSELELNYRGKDGIWRNIVTSISLIRDDKGDAVGFRGLIRNTTERTRAMAEREKLRERLQRSEKFEAVGALAGGVAHDLNNILLGLTSYPELLLSRMDSDDPMVKPLQTIQKSGEKAVAVVQDLLSLSKRGGKKDQSLNINVLVSRYLESPEYLRLLEFHPSVNTETRLDPDLVNVMGTPGHLTKIVMNLVSNAAEAMPDGGKLKISTQNISLDHAMKGYETIPAGDYAMLSVEDTGEGISDQDMERIFEPFYTKRKMGRSGTGLGMAVVLGSVKDHEGYIDIKSRRYIGTTIRIYLPMTSAPRGEEKNLPVSRPFEGNKETILVVDDIAEQREIATEILNKLNYQVQAVDSGEAAIEFLRGRPVDLILLDMIMAPGIDGLDTYKQIVKMYPKQKAIIASGFTETERVKEAMRLGVGQYVKKPYSVEKIGNLIRQELDKDR